jgi:hypothetical protein
VVVIRTTIRGTTLPDPELLVFMVELQVQSSTYT